MIDRSLGDAFGFFSKPFTVPGQGVRMKSDTWSPIFIRFVSLIISFTVKYL